METPTTPTSTNPPPPSQSSPEYLVQLLKDKRQLQAVPGCFVHVERILDEEINRVRGNVLHINSDDEPLQLPEPQGPVVTITEKLTVPVKEYPEFNFVGRLLGPRGMTAKQLELETGCKILVRGRGSMRDKHKEELMRGKAKWEHLNEDLHVLISVEDAKNRATLKMKRAVEQVKKLLVPSPENEDELKKRQLMELALLNGTYRGFNNNNNNSIIATNNNNNNNNGIGFLMMAGPPFCTAGGMLPPGMMAPSGGPQMTTMPIFVSSDPSGAPIFLAGPPPMFGQIPCSTGPVTPMSSPGVPQSALISPPKHGHHHQQQHQQHHGGHLPIALPPPPLSQGFIYHAVEPLSAASVGSATSPMFEFPPGGPEFLRQTSQPGLTYVH